MLLGEFRNLCRAKAPTYAIVESLPNIKILGFWQEQCTDYHVHRATRAPTASPLPRQLLQDHQLPVLVSSEKTALHQITYDVIDHFAGGADSVGNLLLGNGDGNAVGSVLEWHDVVEQGRKPHSKNI